MDALTPSTSTDRARLDECTRAHAAGDFALVHKLAGELQQSSDAEVAAGARAFIARTGVDRTSLGVLALSLVFFLLVVRHYVL
jgi:hypothetical protein